MLTLTHVQQRNVTCFCICSTLDPVLRMEQRGINPEGVGLLALVLAYLTATPGDNRLPFQHKLFPTTVSCSTLIALAEWLT